MIQINHVSFVITIPKADTTLVGTNATTGYEIRSYDEYALMRELADYLDSEEGATLPFAFSHNTSVTISGIVYARALLILAPYTVTFENDNYQVKLVGGTNNNLLDVLNPNSVSVIPANSAGLQTVNLAGGSGATAAEVWAYAPRTLTAGSGSVFATPLQYKADNSTSASDPGSGKLRWNHATQTSATQIYLDALTNDGLDITNYLSVLPAGSTLFIQDKVDAAKYQKWLVTSAVDNTGWATFGVSLLASSGGNIANNQISVLVFNSSVSSSAPTAEENADAVRTELAVELSRVDVAVSSRLATAGYTAPDNVDVPTAAENAATTLAALIEGGLTLQDVLRLLLAVTSGDATGLEGSSMAFKSLDGTKNRIEATYTTGTRDVTTRDAT